MGQVFSINKLHENLRNKIIEMINNPAMTQQDIVNVINAETGKQLISKSSLNRFIKSIEKTKGIKRGIKPLTSQESLEKIAMHLERISFFLEEQYKKTS